MTESGRNTSRIPSLDGLRAISILMVIVGHVGLRAFYPSQAAFHFANLANLGVRVFFVISGFLITGILLNELDSKHSISLTKFYFRRTLRIFPPYYFFILVMVLCQWLGIIQLGSKDVTHALTYTSNYYPERSWFMGHTWSLAVEEQFYLIWPAILLLAGKRRGLIIAASLIFVCPLIRISIQHFIDPGHYQIGKTFETVADSLAVGCLLSGTNIWLKGKSWYNFLLNSRLVALVPLVVIVSSLLQSGRAFYKYAISYTLMNFGIAFCIHWAVTNYRGRVGQLLNSRPLVIIGVMSYSIYLWQQMFFSRTASIATRFPYNLLFIACAAVVSYLVIERPSLKFRQRLEGRIFTRTTSIRMEVIDAEAQ